MQLIGGAVLGGAVSDGLPELIQVVLQLLVLRLQLLSLWTNRARARDSGQVRAAQLIKF